MNVQGKMTPWAKWVRATMKKQGLTYGRLCYKCKGEIDESTIRKQIRLGRTPIAATVTALEAALGVRFPGKP